MNYSELVVLAKEIHERILDKIEKEESFILVFYSEKTEMCTQFKPEYINVADDMYEIFGEFDSVIHINNKEVTHIYKEEEIDGNFYSINFKNGTQMLMMV